MVAKNRVAGRGNIASLAAELNLKGALRLDKTNLEAMGAMSVAFWGEVDDVNGGKKKKNP